MLANLLSFRSKIGSRMLIKNTLTTTVNQKRDCLPNLVLPCNVSVSTKRNKVLIIINFINSLANPPSISVKNIIVTNFGQL
jgi:hypothetical protein